MFHQVLLNQVCDDLWYTITPPIASSFGLSERLNE